MLQLRASSLVDTHAIAAALAGLAREGDIVVLSGEMGAGKTAFAQGFGRALGVTESITSPTFTLVHSYDCGKLTLHHADLYRLERTAEVADLALAELAEFHGVVLVEWGEVVETTFGDHLVVHLDADVDAAELDEPAIEGSQAVDGSQGVDGSHGVDGDRVDDDSFELDDRRLIELSAVGATWAARWASIAQAVAEYRC
jgi:tRNA threonylcarbamoyladenosine biosynthesis protein TsaE